MIYNNPMPRFGRVLTAMATPFDTDGTVDYEGAAALATYLVNHGNDGLVVAGSTGESVTLSVDEKVKLMEVVQDAVGDRAAVLGGVGSSSTHDTVRLIENVSHIPLDGLLVVTPAYNKPSQEGIAQHYLAVAESTDLPIMLYNVPGRTAVNMEPATVLRLTQTDNIVALKEAGTVTQAAEILAIVPEDFDVYSGADELNLPILALGGVGIVSVIAHIVGDDLKLMHTAFFNGDLDTARRVHLGTLPIIKAMFSAPNPVPTKTALAMLDILTDSRVRLPLVEANEPERALIHTALKDYGLLRH